jgi:MFS family permease
MSYYTLFRQRLAASVPTSTTDWNIRYLYLEIVFASVLGGIVSFHSAFAIRLGASQDLVAWLSAAPALIAAIGSIPSARFFAHRRRRKLWLFGSLLLVRAGYGVAGLMPLLFPANAAFWFVIWIVALNLPSIFFTNGFNALLGELVPEQRRAFVFSRRSIIYSIGVVLVTALAGVWLDHVPFPENYRIMYAFGFVVALGSQYYLHRLTVPDQDVSLPRAQAVTATTEHVTLSPAMRRMLFNTALYQFGLTLPGALFNILYINTLKVSDGWIGLNSSAASAGVIVGYLVWERMLRRHTFVWGQQRASLLTWIFPFVLSLSSNLNVIMLANFAVNLMHPGFDLSSFNVLLKLSRPEHRTTYISWYNTVVNGSNFLGPIVGAWLAGYVGIPAVLMLSAMLRLSGGILFNVKRVEVPVEPVPAH